MKAIGLTLVVFLGVLLNYCSLEFPLWGDPNSPVSSHVSPYYIENTLEDTSVPNIVTAVLADYRGFDTMFETVVIFIAGIACIFLLRTFKTVKRISGSPATLPPALPCASKKEASSPQTRTILSTSIQPGLPTI